MVLISYRRNCLSRADCLLEQRLQSHRGYWAAAHLPEIRVCMVNILIFFLHSVTAKPFVCLRGSQRALDV